MSGYGRKWRLRDHILWWRAFYGALRDQLHGRNSLNALEHLVTGDDWRGRLCRKAYIYKMRKNHG